MYKKIDYQYFAVMSLEKIFLELNASFDFPDGISKSIVSNKVLNEDAKEIFLESPENFFEYVKLLCT
jgi:hypothetical protein